VWHGRSDERVDAIQPQAPSCRPHTAGLRLPLQVVPEDAIISEGDGHFKEQQLATQTEAVGIINPPPDIRSIVVRTLSSCYDQVRSVHLNTRRRGGGEVVDALTAPLTAAHILAFSTALGA
jgi:hypothetical protein